MRFASLFLMLLSLTCPLLAQDKDKEQEKTPDRAQVMKWLMQLNGSSAQRKEAEEALLKLTPEQWIEALRRSQKEHLFFAGPEGKVHGLRVLLDPGGSREVITGSWVGGDRKVTYSLKSLGKGRYKLSGTSTKDGEAKPFLDEGTMPELKQRHEFLKANLAIRVPSLVFGGPQTAFRRSYTVLPKLNLVPSLGITVKPPSDDLAYHLFLPRNVGFVVVNVPPGSVAEKLGLEKFDLITKLDGEWIEKRGQLDVKTGTLEYVRRAKTGRLKLE